MSGTAVGSRFGPYLLRLLHRGGLGEVNRAKDTSMGRIVALKVIAAAMPIAHESIPAGIRFRPGVTQ